jgi:outer membrane protein TolC
VENICKINRQMDGITSRLARLKSKCRVHVFYYLNLLALSLILYPLETLADPIKQQTNPAQITQPQTPTIPLSKIDQPTPSQATVDLNPDPNRLAVPKTPLEVGIKTTQGISLKQTLELATRNNRELEQARLALDKARAVVQEKEAAFSPSLSASVDGKYQKGGASSSSSSSGIGSANSQQTVLQGNESTTLSSTFTANYTLFDFGKRGYDLSIAQDRVQKAQLEVDRINQKIRLDMAGYYYDLQNAGEQVRIYQGAVANSQASLRDAQAKETAGTGTHYATLQAQAQLASDQVNLIKAQKDQRAARRQIAQRLDLPQTVDFEATDPIEQTEDWNLGLEETILAAYQSRAELQKQLLESGISQNQALLNVTSLRPQFTLSSSYNLSGYLFGQAGTNHSFPDSFSAALSVSWTLFDGGATNAKVAQAKADQAVAESEFANQRSEARYDVENAFLSLQSQREQVTESRVGVDSAQEGLRLARLRLQAGVGTQTDVVQSQRDLTTAQSNLSQAVIGYNRALVQLKRSVTKL